MKFVVVQCLIAATLAIAASSVAANTGIQLEPTQGILIPAPIAQSLLRFTRSAYGGGGGSSYSAPAAPSYSAPAAPSYSAPAAPSYSAPAASSYSAPAAPAYSAPAAPAYSAPAAPAYSAPASIPAPPCPKNYLFSCQPSLSPVPCSSSSYGSSGGYSVGASNPMMQGAHSEVFAQYAVPQYIPVPQYSTPVVKEVY